MITCPRVVKSVALLRTDKPVTQHALVDVNNASIKEIPFVDILGIRSKSVPMKIKMRKDKTIMPGGLKLNFARNPDAFDISNEHNKRK
jgi:hypothetical protein